MSLHVKQLQILKKYFWSKNSDVVHVYSAIIIGVENTLCTDRAINEKLKLRKGHVSINKAYDALKFNKIYREIHNKNVENLKKLGFVFI